MRGQYSSPELISFGINIQTCKNGTSSVVCAPKAEIDFMIDNMALSVMYTTAFFDYREFGEEIIKYNLEEKYLTTMSGFMNYHTNEVAINQAILSDSMWGFGE